MSSDLEEWDATVPSPLTGWSQRHPEVTFDIRPLAFRWVVRGLGAAEDLDSLVGSADVDLALLGVDRSSEPWVAFAFSPGPSEVAWLRTASAEGGLVLPPLTLRDGVTRIRRLIARSGRKAPGPRPLPSARLVVRRPLTPEQLRQEIERLVPGRPGLTPQQTRVLLEAVRAGYYEVPRRVKVEDVARRLSLGRSTAEEHLRVAESRIVVRAAPLVELSDPDRLGGAAAEEHAAGFSPDLELYVDLALRGDRLTGLRLLRSAPRGRPRPDHPTLVRVLQHLRTGREDLRDLPVELAVSPFERQVLDEVRRIPTGATRSYGEIARRIGRPNASRAVGNAVAHNPVPIVIPCHRVVPLHGGIGNYSATGGPRTKRQLLTREGALRTGPAEKGPPGPQRRSRRGSGDPGSERDASGEPVGDAPPPAPERRG